MNAAENVIGGLLLRPESLVRVQPIVTADDFSGALRPLYEYIVANAGKADAVMAMEAGFIEAIDLAANVFSVAQIEVYASEVAKQGEMRRVRAAGKRIALAESYGEAQALLAEARPQQAARVKSASDAMREMIDALQARFDADSVVTGTPTGLESMDTLTGGWQAGDLIGVGGETSSGKTAFALQAALAAGRCAYFSLEMMASQLIERVVSNVGHIPYRYLRFPREAPEEFLERIYATVARVKDLALLVDDQPGLSLDQIISRARQMHMAKPLRLIVVDHLNLVRRPRKNDAAELGEIAIALKNLAKDLAVPVMVLVQLNRAQKQRTDRRPELQDFRNSGEIEEALDTAVMVYRDEYHNPNGPLKGYAEFIVRKQRQGERNVTAWAKSYLSQMRFESCDEPVVEQAAPANGRRGFASRYSQGTQPGGVSRVGVDI